MDVPPHIRAALDQVAAGGREFMENVVALATEQLRKYDGDPDVTAMVIFRGSRKVDPERLAAGFAWAMVALAQQRAEIERNNAHEG
ncbi:hypothetical protein [Micromonospora sp. 4G55]|uniref:hypothetical protein n=1 Tax=Micromonospora sp. 4G55 TaxID=2806102 RepID=UPI001A626D97|nr:hypothetical protein [Micromonospora sp. 4G55]MBM0256369.1 hypothetical protein [Micromonospora sp. 4G55]